MKLSVSSKCHIELIDLAIVGWGCFCAINPKEPIHMILDVVLGILRQGDKFLEFWFGEFITDNLW